ncbi:MAG TPA: glucose-6-phosphate isomerase family protein [Chthonomonadales bacterium]|nr:glucose-6-phosphate isomerase family protein [Chthonomonadales bacterium]
MSEAPQAASGAEAPVRAGLDLSTGLLSGPEVVVSVRRLASLRDYVREPEVLDTMDADGEVYRVLAFEPAPEGVPGAVCCATTVLQPGRVGDEYFFTRGHYHAAEDRPELEVVVRGEGFLVLRGADTAAWYEPMLPGSVHHVPPGVAHRVANVGEEPLVFLSFWASETGHDYVAIARDGFGARVRCVGGRPALVAGP